MKHSAAKTAAPATQSQNDNQQNGQENGTMNALENVIMIGDAGKDTLAEIEAELKAEQEAAEKAAAMNAPDVEPAAGDETAAGTGTISADVDEIEGAIAQEIIENLQGDPSALAGISPAGGDSAASLAQIEPAAGDNGAAVDGGDAGGYGFNSSFIATDVPPLEAIGPLGPTALAFNVNFPEPQPFNDISLTPPDFAPSILSSSDLVDETDLGTGSSVSGTLDFDFGGDGPGNIEPNGDVDVSGSLPGNALTSCGETVTITETPDGYVGTTPDGTIIFTLSVDPLTGEYVFDLLGPLDHGDPNNPNDIITLQFGVTIFDADGDAVNATITINVADDAPSIDSATINVDETNPAGVINGDLNADFGADGGGSVQPNGVIDVSGSLSGNVLTSGGQPVMIIQVNGGYVGQLADGTTIFTLKIQPDGTYGFQLEGPLDHGDPNNPNDIITLQFGVTITDCDGDSVSATITINVADDGPSIGAVASGTVDESDPNPSVSGTLDIDFGADGEGSVSPDGTYDAPLLSSDGEAVSITQTPDGYVGVTADGTVIFTLTINADGSYEFNLLAPLDHPDGTDPNDILTLQFGVVVTDGDGDFVNTTIVIHVADDGPSIATPSAVGVDETDGVSSVSGQVDFDFGADGAGSIGGDGSFDSSLNEQGIDLTSGGEQVTVTLTADGYVGTTPDGTVIFTLTLNDDGSYEFTLLGTLDHPDPTNPNDIITLQFGVVVTDGDGDSVHTTITVDVADDGPSIVGNTWTRVDEDTLANGGVISITDTVTIDFGADGPGEVNLNGQFMVMFEPGHSGTELTSGGQPVSVLQSAPNTFVGMVDGQVVFELVFNPATGTYTYNQFLPLDHPDTGDNNDVLWLKFGFTGVDADGDPVNGFISIDIQDSGPVAHDDVASSEDGATVTGNVLDNDSIGGDGNDTPVTSVEFDGVSYEMPEDGILTVEGQYGTLVIHADGTYTYTPNGNGDGTDTFTYTIVDGDGDPSQATLSICVDANDIPTVVGDTVNVDETNLGPITVSGEVEANFGNDGPGTYDVNGDVEVGGSVAGGELTSCGQPVTITMVDGGYVGTTPDGTVIFTLTLNEDSGEFEFTLIGTLDHADTTNHNDIITINFGVVVTDADGDTATTTITVNIADDGPSIQTIFRPVTENDLDDGGQITLNGQIVHDFGSDGPGDISPTGNFMATYQMGGPGEQLTSGGEPITVTATADGYVGTVDGQVAFTLTVNPDGSYSYNQLLPIDHPGSGADVIWLKFEVQIVDCDGDTATAVIGIDVHDSVPTIGTCDVLCVDETDLGPICVGGNITFDFGGDGVGSFGGNGDFTATGSVAGGNLTSGGVPVVVTQTPDGGYVGMAGGETIFTLTINADGSYSFTLIGTLDHADANNPNDIIALNFGVAVTDGDGDTANTTITINVKDDAPSICDSCVTVSEEGADCQILVEGNVCHDFGSDGQGSMGLTGGFTASVPGCGQIALTVGGQPVVVTQIANGFIGMVGTQIVMALTIDPATGEYSYQQFANFDNLPGTDTINLEFGVQITDADGDTDLAAIKINIVDGDPCGCGSQLVSNGGEGSGDQDGGIQVLALENALKDAGQLLNNTHLAQIRSDAAQGVLRAESLGLVLAAGGIAEQALKTGADNAVVDANVKSAQFAALNDVDVVSNTVEETVKAEDATLFKLAANADAKVLYAADNGFGYDTKLEALKLEALNTAKHATDHADQAKHADADAAQVSHEVSPATAEGVSVAQVLVAAENAISANADNADAAAKIAAEKAAAVSAAIDANDVLFTDHHDVLLHLADDLNAVDHGKALNAVNAVLAAEADVVALHDVLHAADTVLQLAIDGFVLETSAEKMPLSHAANDVAHAKNAALYADNVVALMPSLEHNADISRDDLLAKKAAVSVMI